MEVTEIITLSDRRKRKVRVNHLGHSVWIGEINDHDLQLINDELSISEPEESCNPYDRVGRLLQPSGPETA